jgi:8-oxo-dGTP diphosphatase
VPSNIAAPEAAAHAVLVDDRGWVLIVRPSYKRRWHLPGGYIHVGETPAAAVARKVQEELRIAPELRGPAVIAWAPHGGADRILFLFAGQLTPTLREAVRIDGAEIIGWTIQPPERLEDRLHPHVAARVRAAIDVAGRGRANGGQLTYWQDPDTGP